MKFNQQTSTTTTMNHIPTTGQLAYSLPERKFTTQLFFPIGLYRDSWDTHTHTQWATAQKDVHTATLLERVAQKQCVGIDELGIHGFPVEDCTQIHVSIFYFIIFNYLD